MPKLKLVPSLVFLIKALVMAVLFLPLFLHSQFFFPFIVPKNVAFRILVEVALGLYLTLILIDSTYRPKLNKITLSVIIFFGILTLSGIFGVNFSSSLWGNYERMSGLFHSWHLLAYFIILANVFREKKDWHQLFAFTIFIAVIACALGLSQKWGIQQLIKSSGGQRLTGPIGNAAFFAGYLLLHIFLILYFLFKEGRFPGKFFAYVILGFNIFLILVEIYKRLIDKMGFIPVIFGNWQLLAFLILLDLIAIYLWFQHSFDFVKRFSSRLIRYLLRNLPLFIILGILLFVIYNTQTRGSILSLWVSFVILSTFGFYLQTENGSKTFLSLLTFGFYPRTERKKQILFAILIVLILVSQVFLYLAKDTAFITQEPTLSRMAGFVAVIAFYLSILSIIVIGLFFEKAKMFKILLSGILILIIVFPIFLYLSREASWVQDTPVLNTFANITSTKVLTIESRILTWQVSFKGMLERPFLGWGQENFDIVFNKYFPIQIFKDPGSRVWFDRAHNIIFDIGVTTGFVGLISYLTIFFIASYYLIKKFRREKKFSMSLLFIVLLFAYFVQNLFVFDTLNTEVVIFLILAFIVFLTEDFRPQQTEVFNQLKPKSINLFLILLIFVPLLIIIYGINVRTLQANHLVFKALTTKEVNNKLVYSDQVIDNYLKATKLTPIGKFETRQQLSNYAQNLARDKNIPRSQASRAIELAIKELKKSIKERSNDIRQYLYLANLYNSSVEFDASRTDKVIELLNEVKYLSPSRSPIYFEIGQAYLFQGKFDEAIEYFKKGVEIAPWVLDSHYTLVEVYIVTRNYEEAFKEIDLIKKQFGNLLPSQYLRFIELFSKVENYQAAINLLLELIAFNPDNVDYHVKLAALYAEIGEEEKAIAEAQRVAELDPTSLEAVETFIDSLNR